MPQKVELKPNKMQESFIKKLDEIYHSGQNRALLISATGTGKTYAAAFSVKHLMEQKKPEHQSDRSKKSYLSSTVNKSPFKLRIVLQES